MRRLTFALAGATLAVATLAGCGGDSNSSDAYCDAVDNFGKTMSNLEDKADFEKALDSLKKIRDEASGDPKEDWDTLVGSFEALEKGDAGAVDEDKVESAGKDLEKQVKDDCDIDLSELG